MIMARGVILPSPGTARLRDSCKGHFTQIRIRFARSSSRFSARVFPPFPSALRAVAGFFWIFAVSLPLCPLCKEWRVEAADETFGPRLSISQFLLFQLRWQVIRIIVPQNSLKAGGGPRSVIRGIIIIDHVHNCGLLCCG